MTPLLMVRPFVISLLTTRDHSVHLLAYSLLLVLTKHYGLLAMSTEFSCFTAIVFQVADFCLLGGYLVHINPRPDLVKGASQYSGTTQ